MMQMFWKAERAKQKPMQSNNNQNQSNMNLIEMQTLKNLQRFNAAHVISYCVRWARYRKSATNGRKSIWRALLQMAFHYNGVINGIVGPR